MENYTKDVPYIVYESEAARHERTVRRLLILDYTFRDSAPQNKQIFAESDYATKDDVESIRKELEALRAKFADTEGSKKK